MFPKGSVLLEIKRIIEAAIVLPMYLLLRLLPFAAASFLIGKLLRGLGRFHKSHQIAIKNLKFCFPEKTDEEIKNIALNSWENLGRTVGELPHITLYSDDKLRKINPISGLENLEAAEKYSKQHNTGIMLVSAHIGNWELSSRMLLVLDPKTALIYRKANNPYVDKIIQKTRGNYADLIIPKGDKSGVRDIVKHIKSGGRVGMLMDQKANDGVEINFFGVKVKAPANAAKLALLYNIPVIAGICIRNEKNKLSFVMWFEQPIYPENKTAEEITQQIYDIYEKWIREYPSQWLWQHNRFDLVKRVAKA